MKIPRIAARGSRKAAGMSLLEVMIAGLVLLTGLLVGVLPMITYGVSALASSDEETIAKQKARQVMESIYGARNTSQLGWDSVKMTTDACTVTGTSTVCGIFVPGEQNMYGPGANGIYGTDDDTSDVESYTMANGTVRTLTDFKRTITITAYGSSSTLRRIQVDISYPVGRNLKRTYTIQSLISQYK
jgi:Tfp pilus assembly protein PilV